MERLSKDDPSNLQWQRGLIRHYINISELEPSKATSNLTRAREILQQIQEKGQFGVEDGLVASHLDGLINSSP